MAKDKRLRYYLRGGALDFPYIGMIESSDRVSYFQTGTLPEGGSGRAGKRRPGKTPRKIVLPNRLRFRLRAENGIGKTIAYVMYSMN